ncbi:hypothetical protein LLG95_12220 [bacterium]|nr:hypothetical protein [bacterium]
MEQTSPRFRPRSLWILLSTLALVPLIVVGALKVLISANAVTPAQLNPPTELLPIKPPPAAANTPFPVKYKEFLAAHPGQAASFYLKYFSKRDDGLELHWNPYQKNGAIPVEWLAAHREFVSELIELANAGGFPAISWDEAAAYYQKHMYQFPAPDTRCLRICTRALIAESRRRREAKDFSGAAEALVAAHELAHAMGGPRLTGWGSLAQTDAGWELSQWIGEGTLGPAIARKIREPIAASAIGLDQYRRGLELEYLRLREERIRYYSQSFSSIYNRNMQSGPIRYGVQNPDLIRAAGWYAKGMATSSYGALRDKTFASREIAKFDNDFRTAIERIGNDQPTVGGILDYRDENNYRVCTKQNLARIEVNLAALDLITSTSSVRIDPFGHAPLRRIEDTSGTLIYSIGPDMLDQRGAVAYFYPRDSKGDIVVRVPGRMQ